MPPRHPGPEPEGGAPPAHAGAALLPGHLRGASLVVLATVAALGLLHWGKAVFIPLLLGLMASYALTPLVDRMARWRVPRAAGAAVLLLAIIGVLGFTVYTLQDDARELAQALPQAARKLARAAGALQGDGGAIEQVQEAAEEIEKAVEPSPERGVQRVRVEPPALQRYLWTGTLGLLTLIGQAVIVVFLTFFLLASGDTFRRKLVAIAGPTFTRRKITVQMLDEIETQIQRYLLVNVVLSLIVGVATGAGLYAVGLDNAAVWGVIAAVTNWIPYLGPIVVTGGATLAAFLQFDAPTPIAAVLGVLLLIQTLEGHLLLPWMTSQANRMNPVVVFVGLLVFAALWGVWGLLLAVPALVIVKAVCDRVEDLQPVGELLAD